jgi:hypothetical protein
MGTRRARLGWLGFAVKWFGATALLFHPSARIQFILFGPGDGRLSIKIFGMRCADDQRISFHIICRRCRLSEQQIATAGVFDAE